ncbi:hypothetical protein A4S06_09415 [Erysipelotrichaceae bacterium MTC7]|nr:hypothetical protein A4S06_09415 [Erysipelotrichaceae bacterium MTC7]
MNEDKKLDNLLSLEEPHVDQRTFKKIKRGMNQSFLKRMVVYTLVIALLIGAGYFGFGKLKEATNYNPRSEKIEGYYNEYPDVDGSEEMQNDFQQLIAVYISVANPGVRYMPLFGDSAYKNLGYGSYEYYGSYYSYLETSVYGAPDTTIKVNHDRIDLNVSYVMNQFYVKEVEEQAEEKRYELSATEKRMHDEQLKKDLVELPDSALVDTTVSFVKPMDFDEIVQYITERSLEANVEYFATAIHGSQTIGFSTMTYTEVCSKSYPGLCGGITYSAAGLQETYKSSLTLLKDHSEFLNRVISGQYMIGVINKEVENIEHHASKVYGLRLVVDKEAALRLLEDENTYYMQVFDAKFSPLQQ